MLHTARLTIVYLLGISVRVSLWRHFTMAQKAILHNAERIGRKVTQQEQRTKGRPYAE